MPTIAELKASSPDYAAFTDEEFADRLYQKHYADTISRDEFNKRVGMGPKETWGQYAQGLVQKAAQGATFGLGDEIAAGAGAVGNRIARGVGMDIPERSYSDILGEVRGQEREFEERHPYQSLGAEIGGGFAGGGPVSRAIMAAPSTAARIGRSALAGAGYGAASGFGASEGGVGNRAVGAATGAAVGGVAGPVISEVVAPALQRTGQGIASAVRYGNQALRNARNPEQAAIDLAADRMVGAGIDPAAVRAAVSPPPSTQLAGRNTPAGQPFNEEDMAEIISRSMRGETAAQIGADYGIHPSTVTRYVNAYRENNPTPMNLIDISKEVAGEGGAAPVTRLARAAYSLAGDESGEAAQRLMGRQETQAGRVSNIVQRSVAGGDFEATRAAGLQNLQDEAGRAYRQFRAEPELAIDQLGDLMEDPLFRQATEQAIRQARVEVIRRNQQAARSGQPAEPPPYTSKNDPQIARLREELRGAQDDLRAARRRRQDATSREERRAALDEGRAHEDAVTAIQREIQELSQANPEVFSPEMLDLIQRQLRITAEGAVSNPNNARHARNLREVFLDRIEDHYPTFRQIRQNYATGLGEFGEEGALEAGAALTTRLGAPAREALRGFGDMTVAQQELFRLGFARKLMDMAANPQVGGAVANQFNTPAVREIVERLYPRSNGALHRQGQQLLRDLRRESITTKTKNDVTQGARTAELGSDMSRLQEGAKAAADVATGRWTALLENLSTRLSSQIGRRGATEVLQLLTETDPARLLPLLNRLARSAQSTQERQAYVAAVREVRSIGARRLAGIAGSQAGKQMAIEEKP